MICDINRDIAFYLNSLFVGLWHGVGIGWMVVFVFAGIHSKASTSMYKAETTSEVPLILSLFVQFLSFAAQM